MQHGELRTLRCPLSVDKLFMLIFTYFSYIFIAGSRNSHGATRIESISEEVRGNSSHGPAETENPNRNDDNEEVRVLNTTVIHVSCLVLCRTWHWPAAQVLSHPLHPLHLRFRRSHLCAQALWSSTLMRCSTAEWRINTNPVSLRLWECPLTDQQSRLEQWSNITLFLRKTCREYINLVQKSCEENSSVMYCMQGEFGKETWWSQTLKIIGGGGRIWKPC